MVRKQVGRAKGIPGRPRRLSSARTGGTPHHDLSGRSCFLGAWAFIRRPAAARFAAGAPLDQQQGRTLGNIQRRKEGHSA